MIIIGITGTIGAGKGTIVDYLIEKHGFEHFSVRGFLIKKIIERGMEVNRDSMVIVANDLRAQNCPSYITDRLFEEALETGKNCVIESIRTPGEVTSLRIQKGFFLLAVDANPRLRYERIVLRNSETDSVSFETFKENEAREMHSDDPNKQNLRKCIEMADFVLNNDGTMNELQQQVEDVLKKLKIN